MTFLLEHKILFDTIILLASSVIAVSLFRRFHLPPILSYFFVGIVIGPYGLKWIPSTEDTKFLAEFGVVFLMFTIGLEFSLPKLKTMKAAVLGLGASQMIVTSSLFCLVAIWMGLPISAAIIVGVLLAMSSTAIVSKQLIERIELNSRHGRFAMSVLLFQDIAVIPFLVAIPIIASNSGEDIVFPLVLSLTEAALVFVAMLAIGRWLLGPLLHEVTRSHSAELFTLTVLLLSLAAAFITGAMGLSLALGGFLAGMALGETTYRHQVEADIRPFQDVLLGLFFVTIGMLIDLRALMEIWYWVLLLTIAIILAKAMIVFFLTLGLKAHATDAFRTAIVLAQCGEFGFVLLSFSIEHNLLGVETNQIILSSILFSMLIAPMLIRYNFQISKFLHYIRYIKQTDRLVEDIENNTKYMDEHIILCGYGRVGQNLACMVENEGYQYIAIDLDPITIREALQAGDNIYYGNCSHLQILVASGIERARLLVITFDDPSSTYKILEQVQKLRPELPILVRTRDETHIDSFSEAGATEIVPETTEASLMLGAHMLYLLGTPMSHIFHVTQDIRSDRYKLLRSYFHGTEADSADSNEFSQEQLLSIKLETGNHAVGLTLGELKLEEMGVNVKTLRRRGIKSQQPLPNTKLQAQDVIVLVGSQQHLAKAKIRIQKGLPLNDISDKSAKKI